MPCAALHRVPPIHQYSGALDLRLLSQAYCSVALPPPPIPGLKQAHYHPMFGATSRAHDKMVLRELIVSYTSIFWAATSER